MDFCKQHGIVFRFSFLYSIPCLQPLDIAKKNFNITTYSNEIDIVIQFNFRFNHIKKHNC